MTETPQPPPPQHEPVPNRKPDRPPTTIPQPIVPHPGSDPSPPNAAPEPGPAPITMHERMTSELRKHRGWVATRCDILSVRRLLPEWAGSFRLRHRNLSYKRKWNLVWS